MFESTVQAYAHSNATLRTIAKAATLLPENQGKKYPDYTKMTIPKGTRLAERRGGTFVLSADATHYSFITSGDFDTALNNVTQDRHLLGIYSDHEVLRSMLTAKSGKPRLHHTVTDVQMPTDIYNVDQCIASLRKCYANLEYIAAERCVNESAFVAKTHPIGFDAALHSWYAIGYDLLIYAPGIYQNDEQARTAPIIIIASPYNSYAGTHLDVAFIGDLRKSKCSDQAIQDVRERVLSYLMQVSPQHTWCNIRQHHANCPGRCGTAAQPVNVPVLELTNAIDAFDKEHDFSAVNFCEEQTDLAFQKVPPPRLVIDSVSSSANINNEEIRSAVEAIGLSAVSANQPSASNTGILDWWNKVIFAFTGNEYYLMTDEERLIRGDEMRDALLSRGGRNLDGENSTNNATLVGRSKRSSAKRNNDDSSESEDLIHISKRALQAIS